MLKRQAYLFRPALFLCLFFLLGLLFVPECDDCYFVYWRFASWKDMLLTRPITEGLPVVGVPANGRYLGNLLGVLQGKLYFTPLGFLRGLLLGSALVGLTVLLGRHFSWEDSRGKEGLALAFSLVALAPRGVWQQVYAWGAGFVNYLLPMIGILILLELLQRKHPIPWQCFVAGLCSCLFLEPVTILLCLGGLAFAFYVFVWDRERWPTALSTVLGTVLGAAVMFTHPGYSQVGSDTRSIGLELMGRNFNVIMIDTLVRPAAVSLFISILLVWLLRKQGGEWRPWAVLLTPIHLLCLADTLLDCFRDYGAYTTKRMVLACALALIWLVLLAQWRERRVRFQVLVGVLALCVLNGPLLVVSPVESRNLFPSYVVLILIMALLWKEARKQGFLPLKWAWLPGVVACTLLLGVYGANFLVYHQRLDSAQLQRDEGIQEINLPLVPFTGWAINEQQSKGDICYLVYREEPWDVTFHFAPYRDFKR